MTLVKDDKRNTLVEDIMGPTDMSKWIGVNHLALHKSMANTVWHCVEEALLLLQSDWSMKFQIYKGSNQPKLAMVPSPSANSNTIYVTYLMVLM